MISQILDELGQMTKFKPLLRANMQRTAICIAFILVSHVTKAQVWKRPGDNMLLNVTALKENCELSANGGAQWRGAASCLEWLSNDDDQILVASSDELRGTVNLQRPLLLHTGACIGQLSESSGTAIGQFWWFASTR